ncbi:MAG: hypothetical protein JZD41_04575 [Thermoproteus sp.]|nr:hypothetical protein [Thermoproteus sp.]
MGETVYKALRGQRSRYPFGLLSSYGSAVPGAGVSYRGRRLPSCRWA